MSFIVWVRGGVFLLAFSVCVNELHSAENRWKEGNAAYGREDYAAALNVFRPLAEKGVVQAQFTMGLMYTYGEGVSINYIEAAKWYRKAANKGFVKAEYVMGIIHEKGYGVSRNPSKAVTWYRKAANKGYGKAQIMMGVMYARGIGVPSNYVMAHMWWSLAEGSDEENVHLKRKLIETLMTPNEIEKAKNLARNWAKEKQNQKLKKIRFFSNDRK